MASNRHEFFHKRTGGFKLERRDNDNFIVNINVES
jgi:hypothetical protein